MIAEAIQKILDIGKAEIFTIGGRTYSEADLNEVLPAQERQPVALPVPKPLNVTTLTGFSDLVKQNVENFDKS